MSIKSSRWTFNPAVLTNINAPSTRSGTDELASSREALMSLSLANNGDASPTISNNLNASSRTAFAVGDIVQIRTDVESVKLLQQGHGEWANEMIPVSLIFNSIISNKDTRMRFHHIGSNHLSCSANYLIAFSFIVCCSDIFIVYFKFGIICTILKK